MLPLNLMNPTRVERPRAQRLLLGGIIAATGMVAIGGSACSDITDTGEPDLVEYVVTVEPGVIATGERVTVRISGTNNSNRDVVLRPYCPMVDFRVYSEAGEVVYPRTEYACFYVGPNELDTVVHRGETQTWSNNWRATHNYHQQDPVLTDLEPGSYLVHVLVQPSASSPDWHEPPLMTVDTVVVTPQD